MKVVYKSFTRKNKDFGTYTKIAYEWERLGQNNCCQGV